MQITTRKALVRSRIERGARLLDERRPGWHQEINLDTLNLNSYHNCVLGQLYGRYDRGALRLGLISVSEFISNGAGRGLKIPDAPWGFNTNLTFSEFALPHTFKKLWVEQILARREEDRRQERERQEDIDFLDKIRMTPPTPRRHLHPVA